MLAVAASAHAYAARLSAEVTLSHELPTPPLPAAPLVVGDPWPSRELRPLILMAMALLTSTQFQVVAAIDTTSCRNSAGFGLMLLLAEQQVRFPDMIPPRREAYTRATAGPIRPAMAGYVVRGYFFLG